jgi:desulfoferrodoxin-like iron-binding protein
MPVKSVNEKYRCNICGNEVIVTRFGGGTLVCCGEEMELVGPKEKGKMLVEEGYEVDEKEEGEEKEDEEEDEEEEEDYKEDQKEDEEELK